MGDSDEHVANAITVPQPSTEVGYGRPPVHSRFQPGQSGNPSGRAKGSRNLKTIFNKILNEEVSLREGSDVRQVSKIEAVLRRVVVDALKGDQRSMATMFRLAEATGHFEDAKDPVTGITRIIIGWKDHRGDDGSVVVDTGLPGSDAQVPAISDISKDEP